MTLVDRLEAIAAELATVREQAGEASAKVTGYVDDFEFIAGWMNARCLQAANELRMVIDALKAAQRGMQ